MVEKGINPEHRSGIRASLEKLREFLHDEPSEEKFGEVLSLIVSTKVEKDHQTLFDYAKAHLDAWPDEVRVCNKNTKPSWKDIFVKEGQHASLAVLFKNLNLGTDNLGSEGVRVLVESKQLKNITILNLWGNNIGPGEAEVLAESENFKNIVTLNLRSNHIGPEGAQFLATSKHFSNLTNLNLGDNDIGLEGVLALSESEYMTNLMILDLRNNDIGPAGTRILVESKKLINLTILNLVDNDIGSEGARILATSEKMRNITSLRLRNNNIDPEGELALAQSIYLSMEVKRDLVDQGVISEETARAEGIIE